MAEHYFFLLLVAALATKQITAILMHGSIFAWLRDDIKKLSQTLPNKPAKWFFTKLDELLSCALCLTTQVAFWFCVLPVTLINSDEFPILILLFLMFTATMAIAGLAMIMQNLSEHLAKDT